MSGAWPTYKPKSCAECGKTFYRRDNQSHKDFDRQASCSLSCGRKQSGKRKRQAAPERRCGWCRKVLKQRRAELWYHFTRRKHCNRTCGGSTSMQKRQQRELAAAS